jgi:hypothetical protein
MTKRPKFAELVAGSAEFPREVVAAWTQMGVRPAILRAVALLARSRWRATHGRHRPRCGAHARSTGKPCGAPVVPGRTRCKLHGGMSTGPRTPEGRRRIAQASRRRMLDSWSRRKAGNRPRSIKIK